MDKSPKNQKLQSVKGMHDILPLDQMYWEKLRRDVREIADFYNFLRIDTPTVEPAELFERPLGESSDVVEKQMFFLKTNDRLVLRPENTAGVVRAYIEHGLHLARQPVKLYYEGSMFRHEQPQAGRLREFHQAGFEILSLHDDPIYSVQVIVACVRLVEALKLKSVSVQMNSIGCRNCRPAYRKKLQDYYRKVEGDLCADCKRRLAVNPLRLLDCKNAACKPFKENAPLILDHLCGYCRTHFTSVLEFLEELHLPYTLNHTLVRGFDYYDRMVFEVYAEGISFALGGGGCYDYLAEMLGGRRTFAVGVAMGMEALIEAMKFQSIVPLSRQKQKVFVIHVGDTAKKRILILIEDLRRHGIGVIESLGKESLQAQLKSAAKEGALLALIVGQKELYEDSVIVRDLKNSTQESIPTARVVDIIKKSFQAMKNHDGP